MYQLSYSDQISLGMIDPDEPEALTRCPGPAHPDAHGCGRFLAAQTSLCERCRAESEAYWHEDIARMAQLDAEFDMQANAAIDTYWRSPEGQAEMAQHAAYLAECDASGPAVYITAMARNEHDASAPSIAHKTFSSHDDLPDDDLPY